jgi:hypothetical protein
MKFQPGDIVRMVNGTSMARVIDVSPYNGVGLDRKIGGFSRYHEGDLELVERREHMEWTEEDDACARQTARQNQGLPCSECGSHNGHFNFCSTLRGNGDNTITSDWYEVDMAGAELRISEQSFWYENKQSYEAAEQVKPYMRTKDFVPEFNIEDEHWLKAMGITL